MGELDGNWLARLPLLVERAVVRVTVAAIDLSETEKASTKEFFQFVATRDAVPRPAQHLSQMVASLVQAADVEAKRHLWSSPAGQTQPAGVPGVSDLDRAFAALPPALKGALVDAFQWTAIASQEDRDGAQAVLSGTGGRVGAALTRLVDEVERQQGSEEFREVTGVSLDDAVEALRILTVQQQQKGGDDGD